MPAEESEITAGEFRQCRTRFAFIGAGSEGSRDHGPFRMLEARKVRNKKKNTIAFLGK